MIISKNTDIKKYKDVNKDYYNWLFHNMSKVKKGVRTTMTNVVLGLCYYIEKNYHEHYKSSDLQKFLETMKKSEVTHAMKLLRESNLLYVYERGSIYKKQKLTKKGLLLGEYMHNYLIEAAKYELHKK